MKVPTEEQILKAANTSKEAKRAFQKLFPELFEKFIKPGEIYSWGTDNDRGSGVVINLGQGEFAFVNFHNGDTFLRGLCKTTTHRELNRCLSFLSSQALYNYYNGVLKGPKHFKSWTVK